MKPQVKLATENGEYYLFSDEMVTKLLAADDVEDIENALLDTFPIHATIIHKGLEIVDIE